MAEGIQAEDVDSGQVIKVFTSAPWPSKEIITVRRHSGGNVAVVGRLNLQNYPAVYEWRDEDYYDGFSCFVDYQEEDNVGAGLVQGVRHEQRPPTADNHFAPGMRLEALDRKYPDLVAVATIAAVSGDMVLINFDGWSSLYDYWCRYDSPEIAPAGTCDRIGITLYLPSTKDNRKRMWEEANQDWAVYAAACGGTLAPEEAFLPLVRPEREDDGGVRSLREACLRSFVSGLNQSALRSLGSKEDQVLPQLPASVRQQLKEARCCGWCGKAFLYGYKCVEVFTAQVWLQDVSNRAGRTSTTCSQKCGETLVNRNRCIPESFGRNRHFFLHPRLFVVPRERKIPQPLRGKFSHTSYA